MFTRRNLDKSRFGQGPNSLHGNGNNYFSPLMNEIECFRCNNFGHKASECKPSLPNYLLQHTQKKIVQQKAEKIWKKRDENCELGLIAHDHHAQWLIDSGCSKHMTSDNRKLLQLKEHGKGNVSFGNVAAVPIRGK